MLLLAKEELKSHQDAKVCYICGVRILKKLSKNINYWKIRDHSTSKNRDAAHNICNLKFNVPNEISVVFHNDSNYDYHFIIKELANEFEGLFECYGEKRERTKLFFVFHQRKLQKSIKIFKTFKTSNNDINKFILLLRKGVCSYGYMDHWEKFDETTFPRKEELFSNLNMEQIADADYIYRKIACKDFGIKSLGKYHHLYLKSDALLLANVFENFRKMYLKIYQLDPAKFLSAPFFQLMDYHVKQL